MPKKKAGKKAQPDSPPRRRRGRPTVGALYPVYMPVRVSHFADTMIAYILGRTDAHDDHSSVVRTAIEHYVLSHPAFDRDEFIRLLAVVANDLQGDHQARARLLADAARVLVVDADDLWHELGFKNTKRDM